MDNHRRRIERQRYRSAIHCQLHETWRHSHIRQRNSYHAVHEDNLAVELDGGHATHGKWQEKPSKNNKFYMPSERWRFLRKVNTDREHLF